MAQDLKEELGRLSGLLSALAPELERIEGRERVNATQMAALTERVNALRKDLDELVRKVSIRFNGIFEKLAAHQNNKKDFETSVVGVDGKVLALDTRVTAIEDQKKGWQKKVWDVAKIVIAAVVGGYVTAKLGGHP